MSSTSTINKPSMVTKVSIDHFGAFGLIDDSHARSRITRALKEVKGRLPYIACAAVVLSTLTYATLRVRFLRWQVDALKAEVEKAQTDLKGLQVEVDSKNSELEALKKRWQTAARVLSSRAALSGKMQNSSSLAVSKLEGGAASCSFGSRVVNAAASSGATKMAAAAAIMWMLRLRVSAGGSVQLRGGNNAMYCYISITMIGPHIKAKFGLSRPQ
ncbi:hypothetical protein FOL47_002524 [Perkinsus chesapeaki]|uniref:Uncharacterized protein n=1 Tax=Perkinsus chesapeaki TaxID=330153 RepID=A0A7J6N0B9_PERCH|nr:hypothetical protein FOL47_002524 [Perkinsus chesapeaki]